MNPVLRTVLLVVGGLWGLAAMTFVLALALAAAKHSPEPKASRKAIAADTEQATSKSEAA